MFGNKKGLEKKLREQGGTIAWATILSADEKWRSAEGGDSGFGAPSHVTDHMKVTLRVEPDGEPPFEVGTAPQSAPAAQPNLVDQLAKLADLRDRGALTDAEFEAQKAKLLAAG